MNGNPSASLKVVVLCGAGFSSKVMVNALLLRFKVQSIIVEEKGSAWRMIRRRIRRLGFLEVLGQCLFIAFIPRVLARLSRKRRAELSSTYHLNDADFPAELTQYAKSVNDALVLRCLQRLRPDVVVVNGTRILGKQLLSGIDAPFINTHVGITPKYRGVHGGYWALANGDRQHCGVTVHLIDLGIDTGGVLYQEIVEMGEEDNFETYPVHQIGVAIPLMERALLDVAEDRLTTKAGVEPSKLWYHPTLWGYLFRWIRRGVK